MTAFVDPLVRGARSAFVLPALEDEFEAVAIGIAKLHGIVAGVVMALGSGGMDLFGTGGESCSMGGVQVGHGISDEAHMNRTGSGYAFSEPEEYSTLRPKPLRSGWHGGPSLPL